MGKKLEIHHHKGGKIHAQRAKRKRVQKSIVSDVIMNFGTNKKSIVSKVIRET